MSDLDATRQQLKAALEAVLPGRVYAHPPTSGRAITPSIYIDQATIGGELEEPTATFPIWVIADGTIEAQIEAHDGLVWNTLLAVYPYATNVAARPMQVAGLRTTIVEADVPLEAFGFCGAPPPVAYNYTEGAHV